MLTRDQVAQLVRSATDEEIKIYTQSGTQSIVIDDFYSNVLYGPYRDEDTDLRVFVGISIQDGKASIQFLVQDVEDDWLHHDAEGAEKFNRTLRRVPLSPPASRV